MRTIPLSLVAITAIVMATATAACKRDPSPAADSKPSTTTANNAPKPASSVVPGSYEDWCEEHQVPESRCTKCNPDLVPAFKASGDWCTEHSVPESQCTKCDPKRKSVRPPKKS